MWIGQNKLSKIEKKLLYDSTDPSEHIILEVNVCKSKHFSLLIDQNFSVQGTFFSI